MSRYEDAPRIKRLIVVPPASTSPSNMLMVQRATHSSSSSMTKLRASGRLLGMSAHRLSASAKSLDPRLASVPTLPASVSVVDTSKVDDSMLVDPHGKSLEELRDALPEGSQVFEEHWYRLERSGSPWLLRTGSTRERPASGAGSKTLSVKVTIAGTNTALADVAVTLLVGRQQLEATTTKSGIAKFHLAARTRVARRIYIDPQHSAWPMYFDEVDVTAASIKLEAIELDEQYEDTRNLVYGKPSGDGAGVKVAVVDSGIGSHHALTVFDGLNTTGTEPEKRIGDWDGHGTHVAGVIASRAHGWRRGQAAQVELHAYRVFEQNAIYANNLSIRDAIVHAAQTGCCLINLSLGGGPWDRLIEVAVQTAWNLGAVCVAAAGNDGVPEVDVPGRYPYVLAISAFGLDGAWPPNTTCELEPVDAPARGKRINGKEVFLTGFSNYGPQISFTAPGSAIVSTMPGDKYGVMSGTSMAAPVATGVLAARIAQQKLHAMEPNAKRAEAIVALAREGALTLKLPIHMQGFGLAR